MAYEKHNYASGDVLLASELNEMDGAIETHDADISDLKSAMSDAVSAQEYTISGSDWVTGIINSSTGKRSDTAYAHIRICRRFIHIDTIMSTNTMGVQIAEVSNVEYRIFCYDKNFNYIGYKSYTVNTSGVSIPADSYWFMFSIMEVNHDPLPDVDYQITMWSLKDIPVDSINKGKKIEISQSNCKKGLINRITFLYVMNNSYYLSPLITCDEYSLIYTTTIHSGALIFLDRNFNEVGSWQLQYYGAGAFVPYVSPAGTKYVYASISAESFSNNPTCVLCSIDSSDVVGIRAREINETAYLYYQGYANTTDKVTPSENYDLAIFSNISANKVYVPYNGLNNCLCFDKNNNFLGQAPYEQDRSYGRNYTLPSDTYTVCVCIRNTYVGDTDSEVEQYITLFSSAKDKGIAGKRIAVIGDSITWLEGSQRGTSENNIPYFISGFQKWLRLAGADVKSYGYSGYPIATGTSSGDDNIYHKIVTELQVDFSNYDIAIIEAGSNDIRLAAPVGSVGTQYQNPNLDTSTVVGAFGALISYIRQSNPLCFIVIVTPLPSNSNLKEYDISKPYLEGLIESGNFWGAPVYNSFARSGYNRPTNIMSLTYDGMHPNNKGMEWLGKSLTGFLNEHC